MEIPERKENDVPEAEQRPAESWRKIYIAVIINTFVVVTALWLFSHYFSG